MIMRRREFIALVGGAAVWPLTGHAQQTTLPVVGFLSSRSPGESTDVVAAFRKGLRQMGFVEGQNAIIAFRWAEGRYERLPALASDLVDLRVAVLFAAGGSPSGLAAKAATSTRRRAPWGFSFMCSMPEQRAIWTRLSQHWQSYELVRLPL